MSRAGHFLRLAVATIAVSPLLLAGCAALSVDRPKEPIAQLLNRPKLARLAIAQVQYGNSAPFQVCVGDACPKPTNKTLASATQRSTTDAVVVPADLPAIAAPSLMPAATLVEAEGRFFELVDTGPLKLRSRRGLRGVYELLGRNYAGEYLHVAYRRENDREVVFHIRAMSPRERQRYRRNR